MDGGHESLHDAEVVMNDPGQGGRAAGGAGGSPTILRVLSRFSWFTPITNTGGIGRRRRDDDPLGATLQVSPSLLHGSEDPRGPHHVLSTSITPLEVGGISLLEDADGLPVDDELPVLRLDCAVGTCRGWNHIGAWRPCSEGQRRGH